MRSSNFIVFSLDDCQVLFLYFIENCFSHSEVIFPHTTHWSLDHIHITCGYGLLFLLKPLCPSSDSRFRARISQTASPIPATFSLYVAYIPLSCKMLSNLEKVEPFQRFWWFFLQIFANFANIADPCFPHTPTDRNLNNWRSKRETRGGEVGGLSYNSTAAPTGHCATYIWTGRLCR